MYIDTYIDSILKRLIVKMIELESIAYEQTRSIDHT